MQLKAVVLPAPLGPISPTISHSSTRRLTPSIAVKPPNRMVSSRTSSTDIAASGKRGCGGVAVLLVERERVSGEPPGERTQHLPKTARIEDDGLQQQHSADQIGDVLLVVG